jgi:hypothetical protein
MLYLLQLERFGKAKRGRLDVTVGFLAGGIDAYQGALARYQRLGSDRDQHVALRSFINRNKLLALMMRLRPFVRHEF